MARRRPIIGQPINGFTGQPVPSGNVILAAPHSTEWPQRADEFNARRLAPQWEWNHNPDPDRWSLTARPGFLRLVPSHAYPLIHARNTLTQSMQDNAFELTTSLDLTRLASGAHAGLAMFESTPSGLEIVQTGQQRRLQYFHQSETTPGPALTQFAIQLRVHVEGDNSSYSFSTDDGATFQPLGPQTSIHFSWWKGARPALFAYTTAAGLRSISSGAADFDWVRYKRLGENPW